jgi:hypothetical protein
MNFETENRKGALANLPQAPADDMFGGLAQIGSLMEFT